MEYRHKRECGVVVEKITREREVVSSNAVTCDFDGISPDYYFLFPNFKNGFLKKKFRVLFSTRQTLCHVPDKRHTAKTLFADVCSSCTAHGKNFAVRILAFFAHGNQPASRSEGNNDGMECNKSTCENNSPRKTMDEMGF